LEFLTPIDRGYERHAYVAWILWLFVSILSLVIFVSFLVPSDAGSFSNTLNAINIIAIVFILGIPFSLSSVIVVKRDKSESQEIGLRSIGIIYITSATFIGILSFIVTISLAVPLSHLSGILLAALLVAVIPCIITYTIAHFFDDWRYSLIISIGIFLLLSQNFGYLPQQVHEGINSLYSIYHLYRFLAVVMSGYQFGNVSQMENALGMSVDVLQVVSLFLIWLFITMLSLLIYRYGNKKIIEHSQLKASPEMFPPQISKKNFAAIALCILLISSVVSYSWNISPPIEDEPETFILYSSPTGGEPMVLGQWWAKFVMFPAILQHGYARYSIKFEVLDWGTVQAPRLIAIQFSFADMPLSQFVSMNESERNEEFTGQHVGLSDEQPTLDTGWTSYWINESRLWVHKMTNQGVNQDGAEFTVKIIISARA
jgi:hypothetical protein